MSNFTIRNVWKFAKMLSKKFTCNNRVRLLLWFLLLIFSRTWIMSFRITLFQRNLEKELFERDLQFLKKDHSETLYGRKHTFERHGRKLNNLLLSLILTLNEFSALWTRFGQLVTRNICFSSPCLISLQYKRYLSNAPRRANTYSISSVILF